MPVASDWAASLFCSRAETEECEANLMEDDRIDD